MLVLNVAITRMWILTHAHVHVHVHSVVQLSSWQQKNEPLLRCEQLLRILQSSVLIFIFQRDPTLFLRPFASVSQQLLRQVRK